MNLPLKSISGAEQALKRFLLLITAMVMSGSLSQARIGESRRSLEGRMLSDRTAVKVPSREQEALLNHRSVPYRALYEYLPEGAEVEIYYKLAEDGQAATSDLEASFPDGWMVHVIYFDGRSVFEAYRRNGAGITRYEEEGILILNKDGSHWERNNPKAAKDTAIGYNFYRADEKVRALRKGNYLILYGTDFDKAIKQLKDEAAAKTNEEAKEKAPDSIRGF